MPLSGSFDDRRPHWAVTVTGHRDLIPTGLWQTRTFDPWDALSQPGADVVRAYLDDTLWRKRNTHRIAVYCRGEGAGVDAVVRAYCDLRGYWCQPESDQADLWGANARLHLTLQLLARSSAVVWFGPREGDCDLASVALWLGIPCRVVPVPSPEPEGVE